MANPSPVTILLFHHPAHCTQALAIKKAIEGLGNISLYLGDTSARIDRQVLDAMRALVILFSPLLEKDPNLYEIIQAIQNRPQLERFLILPQDNSEIIAALPVIFHPLRAQQHHIFTYPSQQNNDVDLISFLDRFMGTFQDRLPMIENTIQPFSTQFEVGFFYRLKAFWQGPRKTIVILSMLCILALAIITYLIFPQFRNVLILLRAPIGFGLQPPEFSALWMNEPFNVLMPDHWALQNRYEGRIPLSTKINDEGLVVQAEPFTKHALLQLEGVEAWPLDQWKAVKVSFRIDALPETAGKAEIRFGINLAGDEAFKLGCRVTPQGQAGEVACFIHEPVQTVLISASREIDLDGTNDLILEFLPETYVVRYYLNGDYFGRASIPSVSLWRGRYFQPTLHIEVWDLTSQGVSCQVSAYQLAHQP